MHPPGTGDDLEFWIDPHYIRAGYSWSFPAGDEVRVGVGSFEPRDHVKDGTVAVSYTHLDVYKRQTTSSPAMWSFAPSVAPIAPAP